MQGDGILHGVVVDAISPRSSHTVLIFPSPITMPPGVNKRTKNVNIHTCTVHGRKLLALIS